VRFAFGGLSPPPMKPPARAQILPVPDKEVVFPRSHAPMETDENALPTGQCAPVPAPLKSPSEPDQSTVARVGGMLVALLRDGPTDEHKQAATVAMCHLACDDDLRRAMGSAGAIQQLVAVATEGTAAQKANAAAALKMLAFNDHENKAIIARAGAIEPLVALLREDTDAAAALSNLAVNDDNREAIAKAGAIEPLVAIIRDGASSRRGSAAAALNNLASNAANRWAIASAGAIEPLVALARDGTVEQREQATSALKMLAYKNDENLVAISKAGHLAGLAARFDDVL